MQYQLDRNVEEKSGKPIDFDAKNGILQRSLSSSLSISVHRS
jgi:hypothetical protein